MSGDQRYLCKARYLGRRPVDGPLNDYKLTGVVSALQLEQKSLKGGQHEAETRCHLEFSDRQLTVTYIKKDEGFESDTESAKSVEPPSTAVAVAAATVVLVDKSGVEEKIIKDHVFRYSESGEDSFSSNSSGGGSDSETSDHNKSASSSGASSPTASSSPTAELSGGGKSNGYKFDHLDAFPISDVLICHTDRNSKTCIVWVVRRSNSGGGGHGSSLEALVFDCLTEDNARSLYRKFHEVSKRSKLERHRRRKSDGGSILTTRIGGVSVSDIFSRPPPPLPASALTSQLITTAASPLSGSGSSGSEIIRARGGGGGDIGGVSINHIDSSPSLSSSTQNKWSLVQHTDRNGVTHIEVEAAVATKNNNISSNSSNKSSSALLVKNGGINSESNSIAGSGFETDKLSSGNSKFTAAASASSSSGGIGSRWTGKTEKSKFAKELETILSSELRRRSGAIVSGGDEITILRNSTPASAVDRVENSGETSGIVVKQSAGIGMRSPVAAGGSGRMVRSAPHGESLSLRQRTPAMLLRKLDEFEEKAHRIWAKAEAEEENRKVWSSPPKAGGGATSRGGAGASSSLIGISAPLPRGPQLDPPLKKTAGGGGGPLASLSQGMEDSNTSTVSQPLPTTPLVAKKADDATVSSSSGNRILIPTKTGQEPPKKLYPKESPPLFRGSSGGGGGGRFVPVVGVSGSQMGILAAPASVLQHHQPHSLPLYPVQLGWSRYPPTTGDIVAAPMSQLDVWKYAAAVQESWRPSAIVVSNGSTGGSGGGGSSSISTLGIGSGAAERSRSRDRSRGGSSSLDPEHRRRAQSKSPARRPTLGSRMGDDVAGIGRMFRDFGDAVRLRIGGGGGGGSTAAGRSQQRNNGDVRMLSEQANGGSDGPAAAGLKSNLKKQRGGGQQGNHHSSVGGDSGVLARKVFGPVDVPDGSSSALSSMTSSVGGQDNKKVHFNKFATVQMMG